MAVFIGLGLLLAAGVAVGGAWYWRASELHRPASTSNESLPVESSTMEEMNLILPADRIEPLKQAALHGDNEAARMLGTHYGEIGQRNEEARWLTLGANRGHCASMGSLIEIAERAGNRREAARWNDSMRRHACTWGKTYPLVSDPRHDSTPLWNEH
jgi:hypothetical protein